MSFFNQQIEINGKIIGSDRVYVIAEMACAHDGDLDKAKALVDSASEANADAIQFELLEPDENVVPGRDINTLLKTLYFTPNQWNELFDYARSKKLDIFSFAYDFPSLQLSLKLKTDAIKLNSSDLMNIEMLKLASQSGLPFTVGTGGSTFEEISESIAYIKLHGGKNCILMQGVQNFPTKVEYSRINRMKNLRGSFHTLVGYADHIDANTELSKKIDLVALGMGAKILEKHITIDRSEEGVDYQSALEPKEFKNYIKLIRDAEVAMGPSEITPLIKQDIEYRTFQKKCIVASRDIEVEEVISNENIKFMRDTLDLGILPMYVDKVFGKRVKFPIKKYSLLKLEDLED